MDYSYKPNYHFSPPFGWINDPNGLILFRGEYHMFYQYHPNPDNDAVGACWGHAVSKDMLRWTDLPVALAPSEPYDKNGCWSGTAVVKDDTLYLIYTGYAETPKGVRQTQCLAYSTDGINFVKYPNNPVITTKMIPQGSSKVDFRDPEAFKVGNEWYIFVGSHTNKGVPQCLLYKTSDLINYDYCGVAAKRKNSGTMWECPNVIDFGEKQALILSPQWYPAKGNRFTNVSSTVYGVGRFDVDKGKFTVGTFRELDGGCDFYATRCMQLDDTTPLLTTWLQMWGRRMLPLELGHGWNGVIGLPRLLQLKNNKIVQKPVDAIYDCFCNKVSAKATFVGAKTFDGISGRSVCLDITLSAKQPCNFSVKLLQDDNNYALVNFDLTNGLCTFDRTHTLHLLGGNPDECRNSRNGVRTVEFQKGKKRLKAQIFVDKSTVEVFIDGGEVTTSNLAYNSPQADGITFEADGEVTLAVNKYDVVL